MFTLIYTTIVRKLFLFSLYPLYAIVCVFIAPPNPIRLTHSERRVVFEQLIFYEKRRMDGFRVKETRDVLTLDELKERVETVDELFDIIEVCMA